MASTKETLILNVSPKVKANTSNKVTVVGLGQVGMACAINILTQKISANVCLVDQNANKLRGELLDLQHGSLYFRSVQINASTDYAISAGSHICIVTAGVRTVKGETRLQLIKRNTEVLKVVIPQIVAHSPNAILLIVSNPVDVLTHIAWKLSGLPKHKVIGAGTNLDSSRFRFLISEKLGISSENCHGWIIGEHGDSSVPVWSCVNVAGVNLIALNPAIGTADDPEKWADLHVKVRTSSYEVVRLKGYTSWAVSLNVAQMVWSILRNACDVYAVSVPVKGLYGIQDDIFISLPAVLGENGVKDVIKLPLTPDEIQKLQKSAKIIAGIQAGVKY